MKNLICAILFLSCAVAGWCSEQPESVSQLSVFVSPTCHACQKAKQEFIPQVLAAFPGRFHVTYYDLTNMEAYAYLIDLEERYAMHLDKVTPIFYMNGRFLNGKGLDAEKLTYFVRSALAIEPVPAGTAGSVNLVDRFLKFTPLVIISAGFVDGINPCAFTVMVFFVSFLALQGYRRRELIVIGGLFIAAVFATYLLLGLGVFGFLYAMSAFWKIIKGVNIVIGFVSIALGCAALIDGIRFYRSGGKTDNLFLQLPDPIKKRIHAVIGIAYRKDKSGNLAAKKSGVLRLSISAIGAGFVVTLLEAVCTGQTYIPTIAFVLKTTSLQLSAFGLLVLYNAMFVFPLVIIFVLALLGTSSQQFASFMRRHMILIKIMMAAFFFVMGFLLIGRL